MMRFSYDDLVDDEDGCSFSTSMITDCRPVFDHCEGNDEVEEELIREGVITTDSDAEASELYVMFPTLEEGKDFIDRLNKYLENREDALEADDWVESPASFDFDT